MPKLSYSFNCPTHSKLGNITCSELKSQDHLRDQRLNLKEIKLLFKLGTRMFNCKENFKNQYKEDFKYFFFELCKVSADSQGHLMDCFILVNCVPELRCNAVIKFISSTTMVEGE